MLPVAAQNRLRDLFPHENKPADMRGFDISWRHPGTGEIRTAHIEPRVQWVNQRADIEYPIIALDLNPTSVQRYAGATLDETIMKDAVADPTIAYKEYRGTRLYDVLNVTIAVAQPANGIPRSVVAKELALEAWSILRFDTGHLKRDGNYDYEWAMDTKPMAGGEGVRHLPAMEDEQDIERYAFRWRVYYTLTEEILVDAVRSLSWEVTVLGEDGEPLGSSTGDTTLVE